MSTAPSGDSPGPRCPTCRRPVVWQGNPARPFCSIACKLVDLGGWLDGAFRLPGPPVGDERGDPPGSAHPGPPPQADEDD